LSTQFRFFIIQHAFLTVELYFIALAVSYGYFWAEQKAIKTVKVFKNKYIVNQLFKDYINQKQIFKSMLTLSKCLCKTIMAQYFSILGIASVSKKPLTGSNLLTKIP